MTQVRRVVGTLGEQLACDELTRQGYHILHRNYRTAGGELDIVCEREGTLVFCEVKTRTQALFGTPEESVTAGKRQRIRRLASEYLRRERPAVRQVRFDVVSVRFADGRLAGLRHIVDAF